MKNLILTTIVSILYFNSIAQDIIIKNDKIEIKAKIEELTENTIKYKKFEMLDGPSYNINKRDVFMIIYKNGSKEYIESTPSQPAVVQAPPVQENRQPSYSQNRNNGTMNSQNNTISNNVGGHEEIKLISKGRYSFGGEELLGYQGYYDIFNKYGYNDLSASFKNRIKINAIAGGVASVGLLGAAFTGGTVRYIFIGIGLGTLFLIKPYAPITNTVQQFNIRANKKLGLNHKMEISPLLISDQMGSHVGISIGF
jgi:hypothetical protein